MDFALERARKTTFTAALVIAGASVVLATGWWFKGSRTWEYPAIYAFLVTACLSLAFLVGRRPRPWMFLALAVAEQLGVVLLTWTDLRDAPDYLAYTIGIYALGVIYSGSAWAYAALLGGGFALLVTLTAWAWPYRLAQTDFWVLAVCLGTAYAGCLVLEQQRHRSDLLAMRLEDANRELRELSYRDPLTGLHNRRSLLEVLTSQRALSLRTGVPLSVVLIDLDYFKKVNDTLGHGQGDEVLRFAGRQLAADLRQTDLAARYGGEEFVLVLPKSGARDAARVAVRILKRFRRTSVAGVPWPVTFSAGAAQLEGEESVESLLERADKKLYEAKVYRNLVRY